MDGDTTHTACMETKRSESGDVWIACAWHTDARTHLAGVGRDPYIKLYVYFVLFLERGCKVMNGEET